MARGNNAQIKTKEATVVFLQKGDERFRTTKREVDEESNSFIVNDVSNYEHAHYDDPSTSYSIPKQDDPAYDYLYSNLSSIVCLPEFPARKLRRPSKRKASVSTSDYASESGFNSESSEEGEEIDGIWDQGMPAIPVSATNKKVFSNFSKGISLANNNARSTPLTMSEYMRRSTFMRFTANERKLLERTFRGYLISQLDEKIDPFEGIALNDEEVMERLNSFEKQPTTFCLACEKSGRSGSSRPTTPMATINESPGAAGVNGRRHAETRPHMKFATIDPLGINVHFKNPLFRKAVARLPDLRLLGHNASKLAPVVLPKSKRTSRQPAIIHLCDELYGTFEYANRKEKVDGYTKTIRPLIFCRTLYSVESFKHQSKILQRRIENREEIFQKSKKDGKSEKGGKKQKKKVKMVIPPQQQQFLKKKRSASEPPPYSKVASVAPLGAFKIRSSRSVSPNRRRHPEAEEPVAIRSPYQCHGEAIDKFKGKKEKLAAQKFMLCIQSNGSYGAFFCFEKTEQSLLMPTRPPTNGTCRFRQMHFENEINHFNMYEFTVIETEMFEYLAKLRFMNADNRCIELRPETKFGAILPRRQIFNYLRMIRKVPKPITWQKKTPKKIAALPCLSAASSGYGSGSSSSRSSVVNAKTAITITLIDILKWLGFYCVRLDENKARFVLLGAFGGEVYPPFRLTNLLELCQFTYHTGGVFCQDFSPEWTQKFLKIQMLVGFQKPALKKEKELFNIIATPVSNMRYPTKAASLTCYKLARSLKLFELYELNAFLEKNYYYVLNVRYTLYSDPDSCEYDTETEEDFEWESTATIYNLGDPQPLYPHQYSLGDFTAAKMKNIRNGDVSNVIPRSRYLQDKLQAGTGKATPKKRARSGLSTGRRYRNWDSSSEDEEDEENRSEVVTPMSDFNVDFDDIEPMEILEKQPSEREEEIVPAINIPEGEKEFEDSDVILMLATGTPLPKRLVENAVEGEATRMAESDPSLIDPDLLLNDLAIAGGNKNQLTVSENANAEDQLSIDLPSESVEVESENRKVRFKLSPVSKSQTPKKINGKEFPKSCLKKKSSKRVNGEITSSTTSTLSESNTIKITLSSPTEETINLFEIQVETEAEKEEQRQKRAKMIKEFKAEISKPLIKKLKEARLEIRRSFDLPDEEFIVRNHDTKWRPVAADVDEAEFEALLKHMEYNWYWYWNGWQKLKDTFKCDFLGSNYSILTHYKQIETAKAIQEHRLKNRNRRSRSINPVQLRFSYHQILNDEFNDNTEKTPFEHYYDLEFRIQNPTTESENGEEMDSTNSDGTQKEKSPPKSSSFRLRRIRSASLPPNS